MQEQQELISIEMFITFAIQKQAVFTVKRPWKVFNFLSWVLSITSFMVKYTCTRLDSGNDVNLIWTL